MGSFRRLKTRSHNRPRGCTSNNAITGVIETLGYRKEKKRFVEDPRMANKRDSTHIRGVLIERAVLSTADTEARTCGYGELSGGSSSFVVEASSIASSEESVESCSVFGIGIPFIPSLLSRGTSSSSVELFRLAFEGLLRVESPDLDPSVPELMVFLNLDSFLLPSFFVISSSSSSLFSVDAPIGTAPYEPVPKPGADRRRRGALDISPASLRKGPMDSGVPTEVYSLCFFCCYV